MFEAAGGVAEVQPGALVLGDGQTVPFDECLWTTQVGLECIVGCLLVMARHNRIRLLMLLHPAAAPTPLQASAATWLADTGLPVDEDGFLLVNDCLQSDGGPPNVFAAGDVASNRHNPRPKAGVFAVRAVSCAMVTASVLGSSSAGMACGEQLHKLSRKATLRRLPHDHCCTPSA